MQGVRDHVRFAAPALGNVDLAVGGPGAVLVRFRQHPDGGPQPLPDGHLGANLELAVGAAELPGGTNPARRPGERLALLGRARRRDVILLPGGDHQRAVLHRHVLGAARVELQFVVPPAGNAVGVPVPDHGRPLRGIQAGAAEFVLPQWFHLRPGGVATGGQQRASQGGQGQHAFFHGLHSFPGR